MASEYIISLARIWHASKCRQIACGTARCALTYTHTHTTTTQKHTLELTGIVSMHFRHFQYKVGCGELDKKGRTAKRIEDWLKTRCCSGFSPLGAHESSHHGEMHMKM
eukprot:1155523-Pelagomonas_calceolata.AAC.3